MTQYWIRIPGPRRPFGDYVAFLWADQACDTDGNAKTPEDPDWTELTVINKRNESERIDVDSYFDSPLVLVIRSERQDLAARLAYALSISTLGILSESPHGPPLTADHLLKLVGEFDISAAVQRLGFATTMPRFEVLANGVIVGHTQLEVGDPSMGVAAGKLLPTPAYWEVQPLILAGRGKSQGHISLAVRQLGGDPLPAQGGVHISDYYSELGPDGLEVEVLGIGFPLYEELFPGRIE